ncbi:flagellin [Exiguobacterium sp. s40]|uniref:flagellin N-terminal helical domain-containing protein n=1 Tax=Exiguobacterium sp. s40 TaxID=2751247 RepID=UPI001BE5E190|nr:flagellin [Exiguobacterium sp. s40]
MIINHNLNSMNAHRNMSFNTTQTGKAMEKLSSGLRINRAGDDAAGLAISEKMRGQIRGLDMASKNAQDGISLIQTAEGALSETHDILQRMRELSTQSSNDTNTDADRTEIQKEVNELAKEITRISENTEFNTKNLMGENGFSGKFHIGSNQGQDISLNISDMGAEALGVVKVTPGATATVSAGVSVQGLTTEGYNITVTAASTATGNTATNFGVVVDEDAGTVTITLEQAAGGAGTGAVSTTRQDIADALNATGKFAATTTTGAITATATEGIDVSTQESASRAISVIDNAITKVSAERSKLGATQNRLEHTINNLNVGAENLQAAESRIRDVDMAKEMMNFTKNNILNQAAQAMMAQSNQQPQAVLQLLR